uniref:G-protein coupled receptors family 1 profile domain-containing protein n=1 Tax=Plectus sambesii TaxID=2011161 RepID=A0A914WYW7_9BILA
MNSSLCLTEEQMRLAGTAFESFLMRYVFPVVFVFGVLGNLTNLCVFLHPKMSSRSNILLAALAIADVAFLLLVLPHSLANYDYFALSNSFRVVYFYAKTHLVAFANWFSACSVWIIVAICVDRLLLARSRILSLSYNRRYVPLAVWLISIVVGTFLLTFYNHVAYDCYQFHYCNGSQVYSIMRHRYLLYINSRTIRLAALVAHG